MRGLENHPKYGEAVVIYNPYAGRLARRTHLLQRTIEHLGAQGVRARLTPTTGPNTAAALAFKAINDGAGLVIAAGGDGTVNEVANGMVGSDVPLAILPAGTANVLAHELKMKAGLLNTPHFLSDLVPCKIALGLLRSGAQKRYFLAMAGAGLDAQIVYDLNLDLKATVGKLAYYVGGFSHVFQTIPQFSVEVAGKRHRCGFALMSRVRNYGGDMEIARGATLLSNEFEVVLFEGENPLRYIRYLMAVFLGRAEHLKGVSVMHSKTITCDSPADSRIRLQVDGELTCSLPATIEIVPEALKLLVPKRYYERESALKQATVCV